MKIKRFEDIIAWQKGQGYSVEIYANFNNLKDYGFKDQICRASVSVSNNIEEGFDRGSNADFRRFLYISPGSCSETKSMLYLAFKLNYINETKRNELPDAGNKISKILRGFINSLNN